MAVPYLFITFMIKKMVNERIKQLKNAITFSLLTSFLRVISIAFIRVLFTTKLSGKPSFKARYSLWEAK